MSSYRSAYKDSIERLEADPLTHLAASIDETHCGRDRHERGVWVAADPDYPHKRRCKECLRWHARAVRRHQERMARAAVKEPTR